MGRFGRTADDVAALAVRLAGIRPERVTLRLPAVPDSLSPMRVALREWLTAAGAPDGDAYDVHAVWWSAEADAVVARRISWRGVVLDSARQPHVVHGVPISQDHFEAGSDASRGLR